MITVNHKLLIGAGCSALCAINCSTNEAKAPNVVLIYADDMGYGDIEALNAASKIPTPNINALVENGINFTDAHTVSSVSTPSRYGLLTGDYSWKSRLKKSVLWGFSSPLIPKEKSTIATMMKKNGYQTAMVGKWHLGLSWTTTDGKPVDESPRGDGSNVDYTHSIGDTPITRGFDYFYGTSGSLDMPPYLIIENDKFVDTPNASYPMTTFAEKDEDKPTNPFYRAGVYVKENGPETFLPRFVDKMKSLISDYSKSTSPFFIYFAMNAPHTPLAPSDKYIGKSKVGIYGDYMMQVDDVIGAVVAQLKEAGVYDNTIIILSSDNGPERMAYQRYLDTGHRSSGELKGVKRDLWEGGHRVPFVVSWAGKFPSGKTVDKTICVSDIYATLADLANYTLTPDEATDSYSILPLITGKSNYKREYTIHHSSSGRFAVRQGDWVLIEGGYGDDNNIFKRADADMCQEYYDRGEYSFSKDKPQGELFNLISDPQQHTSLYEQNPEKVAELTAILNKATTGHNTLRDKIKR